MAVGDKRGSRPGGTESHAACGAGRGRAAAAADELLPQVASGDAEVPDECDRPLPAPPDGVAALAYRSDLAALRAFAARHAASLGLAADRVADLVLAVGELAANTFRHTDRGGVLAIWATGDELICQVQDSGHITDPLAGRRRPLADGGGGHGLWIVHQVCDLVEFRSGPGGTAIRMHLRLYP